MNNYDDWFTQCQQPIEHDSMYWEAYNNSNEDNLPFITGYKPSGELMYIPDTPF